MTTKSHRRAWSVRARMLAGFLALLTFSLGTAGISIYLLQLTDLQQRIDESLTRATGQLSTSLESGIDPGSGQPFTSIDDVLYRAMQTVMPAPNEGLLATTNGQLRWTAPSTVPLRIEEDPDLVAYVTSAKTDGNATITTLTTAQRTYRIVVIPMSLTSDPTPGLIAVAYDYTKEVADLNQSFIPALWVGLATLVTSIALGWVVVGRLLQPLRQLRHTAAQITEDDLSTRIPVTGNDDLAELTRTVNSMLDRVETAISSQRQLLDDVGHELRTPVTIVQGHLELLETTDPQEVHTTRELVLDELDRMTGLINDIVLLAKAQRTDFLTPSEVDIDDLMHEVTHKAQPLGAREWVTSATTGVVQSVDRQKITQALLQLADNAVKYSPDNTRIILGASATSTHISLWVQDEGFGIAPEDHKAVFDRFHRGDNASRADGSGLGLSIVQAIATAHGGTVNLSSQPGKGTTVTITLPLTHIAMTSTESETP
ncbi:sensor histidine kinase [Jonesia denitrificans]|nr:HAMP domain-containing sensor histidine kinase [Jonesia denitrificans]QXB43391.1 HAMP domain-containing histidine kinase [Jonesia denitrificans]